jgi:hypothetical protein
MLYPGPILLRSSPANATLLNSTTGKTSYDYAFAAFGNAVVDFTPKGAHH